MTLHIFNPEHDMALASGERNYTPTLIVQRMARELAWLPTLWAANALTINDNPVWKDITAVDPWGWDATLRHRLMMLGVPATSMPTEAYIEGVRRLSSRRTAVTALEQFMRSGVDGLCGESHWVSEESDLPQTGARVLKAPWSSSGRGLLFVDGEMTEAQRRWCHNIIVHQGGIAVERLCDKAMDWAMEYETDKEGEVRFVGLSLFTNNGNGAYAGNVLAPQADKMRAIGIDDSRLQELIELHMAFLAKHIAPYYAGPLGIDMLSCADGRINPCVEINLRRTMGHVALAIERRNGYDEHKKFEVGFDKQSGFYARY